MSEYLTDEEILANTKYTVCLCPEKDCTYHGKCKECVALHRYHNATPHCLLQDKQKNND